MVRKIFKHLFKFVSAEFANPSNATIARAVGCSTRTVARATRMFHDDGIILKYHRDTYALNSYSFHPLLSDSNGSFSLWFDGLSEEQKDSYYKHGKQGLVAISVIPNLIVDNMARTFQDGWDSLPQEVKNGVVMASAYGISKVKRSSNGNDEGFELVVWHYGDKSIYETSVEENIHPNGSCPLCFKCQSDFDKCICTDKIEGDEIMDSPYIH
jgi:hypothetical protein